MFRFTVAATVGQMVVDIEMSRRLVEGHSKDRIDRLS